jgi:hypothetical protein
VCIEELHRAADPRGALGMGAQRLLGMSRHVDARHGIVAVDAVAGDQLTQDEGALLGGVDQPLAGGGAVAGDDLVGIVLGGGRRWPALRLEAPQPISLASTRTTRALAAWGAAEHPAMPPPTIATSARCLPARGPSPSGVPAPAL